jgi:HEAT repeat protein
MHHREAIEQAPAAKPRSCPEGSHHSREALVHPAGNLRREAAIALGEVGDPNAATALTAAGGDPDPEVRKAARLALQRLGSGR